MDPFLYSFSKNNFRSAACFFLVFHFFLTRFFTNFSDLKITVKWTENGNISEMKRTELMTVNIDFFEKMQKIRKFCRRSTGKTGQSNDESGDGDSGKLCRIG